MTMLVQNILNALAVWGPWFLTVLIAISTVGIYRHWRRDRSLPIRHGCRDERPRVRGPTRHLGVFDRRKPCTHNQFGLSVAAAANGG